jgi:hypothetical protein
MPFQFPNGFSPHSTTLTVLTGSFSIAFQFPNGFSLFEVKAWGKNKNFQFPNGFSLSYFNACVREFTSAFNSLTDSYQHTDCHTISCQNAFQFPNGFSRSLAQQEIQHARMQLSIP